MFGIHKSGHPAIALNFRQGMERDGRFTRTLRAINFDDAPFGNTAAQG